MLSGSFLNDNSLLLPFNYSEHFSANISQQNKHGIYQPLAILMVCIAYIKLNKLMSLLCLPTRKLLVLGAFKARNLEMNRNSRPDRDSY
jgi:hypothetical protein